MANLAINSLDDCKAHPQKPIVIISACLLGQAVRYDGKAKKQNHLDLLQEYCNIKSICPEAESGLGIPRPPVRLIATSTGIEAIGVENNKLNVTKALENFSELALNAMDAQAFILKARSPSCGINNTPIHLTNGKVIKKGSGIFAQHAQSECPLALFYDECVFKSTENLSKLIISSYRLLFDIKT